MEQRRQLIICFDVQERALMPNERYDGEHRALGVIKQLEVIQTHVDKTIPKIRVTIEEVGP